MKKETSSAKLEKLALENHGVISVREAKKIGVSPELVRRFAYNHKSDVDRVARGVYVYYANEELIDWEKTSYATIIATLGEGFALAGATVLSMLELSYVLSNVGYVYKEGARQLPSYKKEGIVVDNAYVKPPTITKYFNIPSVSVYDAYLRTHRRIDDYRIEMGVKEATKKGWMTRAEANDILGRLNEQTI
jgi:hypothetical protein